MEEKKDDCQIYSMNEQIRKEKKNKIGKVNEIMEIVKNIRGKEGKRIETEIQKRERSDRMNKKDK